LERAKIIEEHVVPVAWESQHCHRDVIFPSLAYFILFQKQKYTNAIAVN
jgi:hypothetical protein